MKGMTFCLIRYKNEYIHYTTLYIICQFCYNINTYEITGSSYHWTDKCGQVQPL